MAAANPREELKRFIQSAGRREALKKLQGFEFLIKKEDSVAFGVQPGAHPIPSSSSPANRTAGSPPSNQAAKTTTSG